MIECQSLTQYKLVESLTIDQVSLSIPLLMNSIDSYDFKTRKLWKKPNFVSFFNAIEPFQVFQNFGSFLKLISRLLSNSKTWKVKKVFQKPLKGKLPIGKHWGTK